jgi:hypothetical protein
MVIGLGELLAALERKLKALRHHDQNAKDDPQYTVTRLDLARLIGCAESTMLRHVTLPPPISCGDDDQDHPRGVYVYRWTDVRTIVMCRVFRHTLARYFANLD